MEKETTTEYQSMKEHLDPPNSKYDDYVSATQVGDPTTNAYGTAGVTRTATIDDDGNKLIRPIFDPEGQTHKIRCN
jgi:hypothetical protein